MNVTQRTDNGFDVTAPASTVFKMRDELTTAWDDGDTFVEYLAEVVGGMDDDSAEDVTVTLTVDVVADAADVLEVSDEPELAEIGEQLQKQMQAHNEKALDEAERAASE